MTLSHFHPSPSKTNKTSTRALVRSLEHPHWQLTVVLFPREIRGGIRWPRLASSLSLHSFPFSRGRFKPALDRFLLKCKSTSLETFYAKLCLPYVHIQARKWLSFPIGRKCTQDKPISTDIQASACVRTTAFGMGRTLSSALLSGYNFWTTTGVRIEENEPYSRTSLELMPALIHGSQSESLPPNKMAIKIQG